MLRKTFVLLLSLYFAVASTRIFTLNMEYEGPQEKTFIQLTLPLPVLLKFEGKMDLGSKRVERKMRKIDIKEELKKMVKDPDYRLEIFTEGERFIMWLDEIKCRVNRGKEYKKVLITVRERGKEQVHIRIPISFLRIFEWIIPKDNFPEDKEAIFDYLAHPGKYINCYLKEVPLLYVRNQDEEVIILIE